MLVYTDNEGRILAVGSTDDTTLIEHEITDNTFDGWSDAKIMCYRVYVDSEGNVTMMTPRIDSREIRRIDAPNKGTQIVDEKVEGVKGSVDETASTMDMLLTDVTPNMMGILEENKATIDMILTEILPELMG